MEVKHNVLLFTVALLMCAQFAMSVRRCSDCGTTPVPYPLSTSTDCGDQSYRIRCETGRLRFDTLNSSYLITSLKPQTQRFVIRPANLLPNSCVTSDLPSQGIQLNSSLPFTVTSSNTIIYLNCSDAALLSPGCSSSLCRAYINGTSEVAACEDAPICCTFRAGGSTTSYSIRVRDAGCKAYRSFVNLDWSLPVNRWPEPGVEIQWASPPEPICGSQADCSEGLNSTCGPDPTLAGVSRCFCNSGFKWDPTVGVCVEG